MRGSGVRGQGEGLGQRAERASAALDQPYLNDICDTVGDSSG